MNKPGSASHRIIEIPEESAGVKVAIARSQVDKIDAVVKAIVTA